MYDRTKKHHPEKVACWTIIHIEPISQLQTSIYRVIFHCHLGLPEGSPSKAWNNILPQFHLGGRFLVANSSDVGSLGVPWVCPVQRARVPVFHM